MEGHARKGRWGIWLMDGKSRLHWQDAALREKRPKRNAVRSEKAREKREYNKLPAIAYNRVLHELAWRVISWDALS